MKEKLPEARCPVHMDPKKKAGEKNTPTDLEASSDVVTDAIGIAYMCNECPNTTEDITEDAQSGGKSGKDYLPNPNTAPVSYAYDNNILFHI